MSAIDDDDDDDDDETTWMRGSNLIFLRCSSCVCVNPDHRLASSIGNDKITNARLLILLLVGGTGNGRISHPDDVPDDPK